MEDPAHEAKKIVRASMSSIIDSFSDDVWDEWFAEAGPVSWRPTPLEQGPPMIDMVVGRHVTFVSAAVDHELRMMEQMAAAIQAEFAYSMKVIDAYGAWPTRVMVGIDGSIA